MCGSYKSRTRTPRFADGRGDHNGVMDAPSQTPELSRELADLRRRAYGPDADIQRDPEALDRLHELEEIVRVETEAATVAPIEEVEPPSEPVIEGKVSATQTEPAEPTATIAGAQDDPQSRTAREASARPWWRRGIVWAIAAVSLLAGVAIGAWAYSLTLPRPDFTMEIDPGSGERGNNWNSVLAGWGVDPGSAVPYGQFNGLDVWTVISDHGSRCVLITRESDPMSISCAAQDLDPTLDLTVYPGMAVYFDEPMPDGTLIRMIARTGGIDVWVRTPGVPFEDQSLDTSWRDSAPSAP